MNVGPATLAQGAGSMSSSDFQRTVLASLRFVERQTQELLRRQDMTDQAIDDLTAGDAAETSAINQLIAAYQADAQALSQANAANDPAIEAIAQKMQARAQEIQSTLNPPASTISGGAGNDSPPSGSGGDEQQAS